MDRHACHQLPPLVEGMELKAYIVQIFEVQNGKIVAIRNYDYYEPFAA